MLSALVLWVVYFVYVCGATIALPVIGYRNGARWTRGFDRGLLLERTIVLSLYALYWMVATALFVSGGFPALRGWMFWSLVIPTLPLLCLARTEWIKSFWRTVPIPPSHFRAAHRAVWSIHSYPTSSRCTTDRTTIVLSRIFCLALSS